MAEVLTPEAQSIFDFQKGMQQAIAERDQKRIDDLQVRASELAVGYAKDRADEAKASIKAAEATVEQTEKARKSDAAEFAAESVEGNVIQADGGDAQRLSDTHSRPSVAEVEEASKAEADEAEANADADDAEAAKSKSKAGRKSSKG